MWLQPRETAAHAGTAPAAAMTTPFPFPCGPDFVNDEYTVNQEVRDQCAPPAWDQYWRSSVGYYSPALCPQGYTAGCLRWDERQGPPVEATETAVQCVPSGYYCANRDISYAVSYTTSAPMIQIRWAESDLHSFATHPMEPGADPLNYQISAGTLQDIRTAQGVLARQFPNQGSFFSPPSSPTIVMSTPSNNPAPTGDSPLPTAPSTTADTSVPGGTSTQSTVESPGGPAAQTPHGSQSSSSSSSGLSGGAKAGIGIGIALVIVLIVGGVAVYFWRKRRNGSRGPLTGQSPPPLTEDPYTGISELGSSQKPTGRHEMSGEGTPVIKPPPPAVLAKDKDSSKKEKVELPAHTQQISSELDGTTQWHGNHAAVELHADPTVAYTELPAESRQSRSNINTPRSPMSPIPRKKVQSHGPDTAISPTSASVPDTGIPDTGVSINPGMHSIAPPLMTDLSAEPSADEINALREQHAQLEARRQRILELEQIEREQEEIAKKMANRS